jgi:multicomponent K+:H+ antiporter subunit E
MKRWLPFPLLWVALVAMWLTLAESVAPFDVAIGALAAFLAVSGFSALQAPQGRLRSLRATVELLCLVGVDVVRSNLAVARIVLRPHARGRHAGFVDIALDTDHPVALAVLACIITSTPGTAWVGYDPGAGMITIHVLDLREEPDLRSAVKDRYEKRLLEMFR